MKDDEQEEKVWEMMSEKWKWREAAQKQINSVQRKKLYLRPQTGCMLFLAKIVAFVGKYFYFRFFMLVAFERPVFKPIWAFKAAIARDLQI